MPIETAFHHFPQLETDRLILRRMHLTDAHALYAILSDTAVTEYYDDDPFTAVAQAKSQIEAWENGYRNRRSLRWGITLKSDDTVIGSCGFYDLHPWHLRAGIGYELARAHWRQHIMTEALTAILGFGFRDLELNRIQALVMPGNVASIRLLENLGFAAEGVLAQYENWGSKGHVDLLMFGLLKSA